VPYAPWSAEQALGEPNAFPLYGDSPNAWATSFPDSPGEYIELRFVPPVPINTVSVYETLGPGSITQISVPNPNTGCWEVVWSGSATIEPPFARIFTATFPMTSYPVTDVRLEFDSLAVPGYSEIDAVSVGW